MHFQFSFSITSQKVVNLIKGVKFLMDVDVKTFLADVKNLGADLSASITVVSVAFKSLNDAYKALLAAQGTTIPPDVQKDINDADAAIKSMDETVKAFPGMVTPQSTTQA